MRPVLLRLDDALETQPAFVRAAADHGGRHVWAQDLGPALRLWSRGDALRRLAARLNDELGSGGEPELVFAGSGDFHHVTPLLLARAAAAAGKPVTLLHFDNHPDWARFAPGRHCGSWVGLAARLPGVARVVSVGVTSPDVSARGGDLSLVAESRLDLFAWKAPNGGDLLTVGDRTWPTLGALGDEARLALLDGAIPTRSVYVTIDKDVLEPGEATTNWDQGCASVAFLEAAVRRVARGRRIVGADVVGDWSQPVYGPGPLSALVKRGEAWLDQPRRPNRAAAAAARVNEATNLRLLGTLLEVAA